MPAKKARIPLPTALAAKVMFISDRTCCICRIPGKPTQIHHIDENPANNDINNLSVLCLEDHNLTQIKGGFGRKLDADQVILYRDDWLRLVSRARAAITSAPDSDNSEDDQLEVATSIAEIYRDNKEWLLLSIHYAQIGNIELRDKYIELAIKDDPSDSNITFLRAMQERTDLISNELIKRELRKYDDRKDWTQKGRFLKDIGRNREAIIEYLKGVQKSLDEGNNFSAAFYLKELVDENLIEELYLIAYEDAVRRNELWWQVRVLQDLGWQKELNELLLKNKRDIEISDDILLKQALASASGDTNTLNNLRKQEARESSAKELF